jgi:transcriptional antiterminator RfaH
MPILPAELDRFPETLFEGYVASPGESWWVLHTRPRQEKALARELRERGLPFYLPQVARRSLIRGRVMTAHVPLFTSYLFLLGNDRQRLTALGTRRVVQALAVSDQARLGAELAQVHRLIEAGAPITPEERLGPGAEVEICSGALAGLRGTVVRSAAGRRFVVRVDFIQRGASVELDDYTLVRTFT